MVFTGWTRRRRSSKPETCSPEGKRGSRSEPSVCSQHVNSSVSAIDFCFISLLDTVPQKHKEREKLPFLLSKCNSKGCVGPGRSQTRQTGKQVNQSGTRMCTCLGRLHPASMTKEHSKFKLAELGQYRSLGRMGRAGRWYFWVREWQVIGRLVDGSQESWGWNQHLALVEPDLVLRQFGTALVCLDLCHLFSTKNSHWIRGRLVGLCSCTS